MKNFIAIAWTNRVFYTKSWNKRDRKSKVSSDLIKHMLYLKTRRSL